MSRCLVTGGAGFLGSHLCTWLLHRDDDVVVLDDLSSGNSRNVSPRVRFVDADVVEPLPDLGTFDRIYHLACPASVTQYRKDPLRTFRTAVVGTDRVLERAAQQGARIIVASTSEVYGDPQIQPQHESYRGHVDPVGVRACYKEGKRAAETLAMDFHRAGVDVRIVRLFNAYGPCMDKERVVGAFLSQALRGKPLVVQGDGSQRRSFCHVNDIVEGLLIAMEHNSAPGPINLGSPDPLSILELAHRVQQVVGDTGLSFAPAPPDHAHARCPDISVARAMGWNPRIPLIAGLYQTAASI